MQIRVYDISLLLLWILISTSGMDMPIARGRIKIPSLHPMPYIPRRRLSPGRHLQLTSSYLSWTKGPFESTFFILSRWF
ncbi:hypothetical protein C8R44DRAFT_785920 [Mycena epipterygia]|nr:hypothetical protein C8R44DRAFT_785920 [Mycena epipterygia]